MARGLVVAATSSGSGKTVLTLGLLRALRNRGLKVASCKAGPDFIDPRYHEAATGRPCLNLDLWAMGEAKCRDLFTMAGHDADIVVVEGVMGLFDGAQGGGGSTADLAQALGLPILLIVDASRQSQSAAAVVHGFQIFRKRLKFAGVIFNNLGSPRHAEMVTETLAKDAPPVLGLVRANPALHLPSRHLGLIQAQEIQNLEEFIEQSAASVAREANLDELLTNTTQATDSKPINPILPPLAQSIAVASDEAFAFAYPHLILSWHAQGASIVPFSPLADDPVPETEAVFLPGGYPELHAGRLAANARFLASLRASQALVYGECGGFMVLGDGLIDQLGERHRMAGLLPLVTSFATRERHLGYRNLKPLAGPWTKPLRGHEFHYSTIESQGDAEPLFTASDAVGNELGPIGLKRGNVMGSYMHVIGEAP